MRLCLLLLTFFMCVKMDAQDSLRNVNAKVFSELMKQKDVMIIDLRTDDEIRRKGMINGAAQIDFLGNDVTARLEALDRKKTYLIYCAGGGRSADCRDMMKGMGFINVVNLEKGFDDWARKGMPVVKRQ